IIQSAAHEDANIIFGAVMDESMKDEVKITVIATGFREDVPERRDRSIDAASLSRAAATHGMSPVVRAPAVVALSAESRAEMEAEAEQFIGAAPAPMQSQPPQTVTVMAESNYDRDELDVPTFLRRRGEIQ